MVLRAGDSSLMVCGDNTFGQLGISIDSMMTPKATVINNHKAFNSSENKLSFSDNGKKSGNQSIHAVQDSSNLNLAVGTSVDESGLTGGVEGAEANITFPFGQPNIKTNFQNSQIEGKKKFKKSQNNPLILPTCLQAISRPGEVSPFQSNLSRVLKSVFLFESFLEMNYSDYFLFIFSYSCEL